MFSCHESQSLNSCHLRKFYTSRIIYIKLFVCREKLLISPDLEHMRRQVLLLVIRYSKYQCICILIQRARSFERNYVILL